MHFQLKQFIYFCADMKRMTRFYMEVLGLRPMPDEEYSPDEWLRLDGGGFVLCLHYSERPGSAPGNRNKLVFSVDDVGAARDHLIAHGVEMGPHHHWGDMEASDGHDPEGNTFQIAGPAKAS